MKMTMVNSGLKGLKPNIRSYDIFFLISFIPEPNDEKSVRRISEAIIRTVAPMAAPISLDLEPSVGITVKTSEGFTAENKTK